MVPSRALAAIGLAAWLAGCAQGRDAGRPHATLHERPGAAVPTLGPDDGLPFTDRVEHDAPRTPITQAAPEMPADETTARTRPNHR